MGISSAVVCGVRGQDEEVDPVEALSEVIPGAPGEDYPIFATPPETSFLCDGKIEGYYADPEADCQAFHICANLELDGPLTKYSLLCPNGTLFNQQYFICDWWFNVDCSQAEDFYVLNEEVAEAAAAAAADGQDGEPSNELASYTLPDPEILATGVLPPPAAPAKLTFPNPSFAQSGKIGRRRGGKKNTRFPIQF